MFRLIAIGVMLVLVGVILLSLALRSFRIGDDAEFGYGEIRIIEVDNNPRTAGYMLELTVRLSDGTTSPARLKVSRRDSGQITLARGAEVPITYDRLIPSKVVLGHVKRSDLKMRALAHAGGGVLSLGLAVGLGFYIRRNGSG